MIIKAIRGMHDITPEEITYWHFIESTIRRLMQRYSYEEIRFPIVEELQLFKRTIGEVTDIVEKEMYEFTDRNGVALGLRPEGTAGCVRACIEHGLLYNQTRRLWYFGPMFRHERPQKGRYRQFYQLGVEAFGFPGPDIDAELILLTARLWRELGINEHIHLNINSIGTPAERERYRQALVEYFSKYSNELDEDSQRRLTTNPLRILDSKNPQMILINQNAPKILDYLEEESQLHFEQLCELLTQAKIKYKINPTLVRGLDYYTKTVFEWITQELGAQGTVCAGGRYDGLVEVLGGKSTPAIGFALGIERIIEIMKLFNEQNPTVPQAYLILVGEAQTRGLLLAEEIREKFPNLQLVTHCGGGNFKKQFKNADKSGAQIALILGDDEISQNKISIKFLRNDKPQQTIPIRQLLESNFPEDMLKD